MLLQREPQGVFSVLQTGLSRRGLLLSGGITQGLSIKKEDRPRRIRGDANAPTPLDESTLAAVDFAAACRNRWTRGGGLKSEL